LVTRTTELKTRNQTLLFSQHVAGLQIKANDGSWKHVRPVDGGITVNVILSSLLGWQFNLTYGPLLQAADTLSFLTVSISCRDVQSRKSLTSNGNEQKGYIKSTIHRVVAAPEDQANVERLGLLYFVRPGDDTPIVPADSPVLRRVGLVSDNDVKSENVSSGYGPFDARGFRGLSRRTI
jgi:hypothetical protein